MGSLDHTATDNPVLWVFGYGSLLWKPNFCCNSKVVGYVEGYERRFNQGNDTFRGVPGKPGRVANLEEKAGSKTWGVAYEIRGQQEVSKVLRDLDDRESRCGGYVSVTTVFYAREYAKRQQRTKDVVAVVSDKPDSSLKDTPTITATPSDQTLKADCNYIAHRPVQVLLYTASPENSLYLGSDSMSNMAHQIVDSTGTAGTNVEYVLKIAEYIRKYIPEEDDDYLFELDAKIREELYRRINLHGTNLDHYETFLKFI